MKYYLIACTLVLVFLSCANNRSGSISGQQFWSWQKQGAFVIDSRTAAEYAQGNISGAKNIPYDQIDKFLAQLPKEHNAQILVYCRSGRRSDIARDKLLALGYKNVFNAGGYSDLIDSAAK